MSNEDLVDQVVLDDYIVDVRMYHKASGDGVRYYYEIIWRESGCIVAECEDTLDFYTVDAAKRSAQVWINADYKRKQDESHLQ